MLQRVQTLYLLAATALMALITFLPMVTFTTTSGEEVLKAFDLVYIGVLLAICTLIPFVTIWLFKNRWLQIRLCFAELVLLLGAQIFSIVYTARVTNAMRDSFAGLVADKNITIIFPAIAFILVILAIRGIIKDQQLIKSLDRIR
ncbi:MAG: DUF4293 domain-containing protein [Tidjanibacter sp.]|nr:DUF4293 domain-containing protein [Tidjanibacter sp.]